MNTLEEQYLPQVERIAAESGANGVTATELAQRLGISVMFARRILLSAASAGRLLMHRRYSRQRGGVPLAFTVRAGEFPNERVS